jgi:hypothetical protein
VVGDINYTVRDGADRGPVITQRTRRSQLPFKTVSTTGERKRALTQSAILRLCRRQKMTDIDMMVKDWVESLDVVDEGHVGK